MKKALFALFLLACVCGAFFAVKNHLDYKKYDFSMQSVDGKKTLADFRGEKLIIYFGYTFCPDVCPTTLTLLNEILEKNSLLNEYKLIFITLDPQRDTPKNSDEFAKYFVKNSVALVPSQDELLRVTKNYGVSYAKIDLKDSFMKYSIGHSGVLYVFDENGRLLAEISNPLREEITQTLLKFR